MESYFVVNRSARYFFVEFCRNNFSFYYGGLWVRGKSSKSRKSSTLVFYHKYPSTLEVTIVCHELKFVGNYKKLEKM
jgi:hypothetical protein